VASEFGKCSTGKVAALLSKIKCELWFSGAQQATMLFAVGDELVYPRIGIVRKIEVEPCSDMGLRRR
jgi:hypothetical protein